MAASTVKVTATTAAYDLVAEGQEFVRLQLDAGAAANEAEELVRVHIGASLPDPTETDYFVLKAGEPLSLDLLGPDDNVYVRAEASQNVVRALSWVRPEVDLLAGLSVEEAAFLDGALEGSPVASKAAVYGADTILSLSRAALAATGVDATDAALIAKQVVAVTASDGTKGVALPAASTTLGPILVINTVLTTGASLKVYPVNGGNDQINGGAEDAAFVMGPGEAAWFIPTSATQWYVFDKAGNLLTKTEINLLVGLLATAAEINRVADVSTRVVTLTGDTAIDLATHEGKTLLLGEVGGNALLTSTLPAATGSGAKYPFKVAVVNTSNYVITKTDTDVFKGVVTMLDNDSNAATAYSASGTDNTLTLNGTTTGGQIGDWVEFEDILAGVWAVRGALVVPAGSNVADPFSAT